jgi:RNA polymerase sigma factor (sigma-70 family)
MALLRSTDQPRSDADVHGIKLDVWQAILDLPIRQRACVALRYLDDMTEAQIADVLELPVGTIKSQLSRARTKMLLTLGEGDDVVDR